MRFAAASRAHDFAAGEMPARAQAASACSLSLAGGAKASHASGSYQGLQVLPVPGGLDAARFPSPSPMATGVFPGVRGYRARSGRAQRSSNAGGLNEVPRVPARGTEVARRCPTFVSTPTPTNPSRAAVTGATSSRRREATLSAAHGLTARAAHNPSPSAGSGAARPADIPAKRSPFAVDASNRVTATGTAITVGPSPAVTPRVHLGDHHQPSNYHRSSTTPQAGWVQSATNRKD